MDSAENRKQLRIAAAAAMLVAGPGSIDTLVWSDFVIALCVTVPYLLILLKANSTRKFWLNLPVVTGGLFAFFSFLSLQPGSDAKHVAWCIAMIATNSALVWTAFRAHAGELEKTALLNDEKEHVEPEIVRRAKLCARVNCAYLILLLVISSVESYRGSVQTPPVWFFLLIMTLLPYLALLHSLRKGRPKVAGMMGLAVGIHTIPLALIAGSLGFSAWHSPSQKLLGLGFVAAFYALGLAITSISLYRSDRGRTFDPALLLLSLAGGLVYVQIITAVSADERPIYPVPDYSRSAISQLQSINAAEGTFFSRKSRYGTLEELGAENLLPEGLARSPYQIGVLPTVNGYTAYAYPRLYRDRYTYYSTSDSIIRRAPSVTPVR